MVGRIKLILVLSFQCLFVFGQIDNSKNFIYYSADSILLKTKIEYRDPSYTKPYLFSDSIKYSLEHVKFFKADNVLFAKYEDEFLRCIFPGKMNFYEGKKNQITFSLFSTNKKNQLDNSLTSYRFYSKGLSNLKKTNYANLKLDMMDNMISMKYLKRYQSNRICQNIAAGLAFSIITYSAINISRNFDDMSAEQFSKNVGFSFLGFGFFIPTYICYKNKHKNFTKATNAYNLR